MSYTYPEALEALEAIANDYIKIMRPNETAYVTLQCDPTAQTASVQWFGQGVTVHMPVRPAVSSMTQAEFEDWTAYLLHELGHPTHTDKAAWEHAIKSGVAGMTNALEDVRMEKALIASDIVPNAKKVLSRLLSRKVAEARATGWKPNARRECSWTICVLGRAANGYAFDAADMAWIKSEIKPGSTVGTIFAWALPELDACKSTDDCVALAKKIMAALAVPQAPDKDEAGKGKGKGKGKGEAGEGEAGGREAADKSKSEAGEPGEGEAGKGEGEGEGEEGEEGEGEQEERASDTPSASETPSNDNEGEGDAGKEGKGHGDGTANSDEMPITSEKDLANERSLAPEGEAMTQRQGANVERLVLDILRNSDLMRSLPGYDAAEPLTRKATTRGNTLKEAAARASKQRALLARALRANETDEREGSRKAGRLDKGALSRAMAGSPNVFARREISDGFDTDVCILLDASGSMSGESIKQALETGLIIAQAAGSVGASCTTEIFNSYGYKRAGALATKRVPNPADYSILLGAANGGTPLSAHMARMALAQAKRAPHKRRVLFVVTDGGCDYGTLVVKRMANYLEQAHGTVMAHVSIGTPLTGAFRAEVMVPFGTPLADIGLDHFVKVLRAL